MIKRFLVTAAAVTAIAGVAWGADLTPVGAERGGSKDGQIPAWEGKLDTPLSGWSYGKYRGDYWRHKDEKPLFSIDASNVDKYKDKLSPGQVQLIKQTKGYRMNVYPPHRNADFPEFILANTKKNASSAKLDATGNFLANADLPGIPFPAPKNGAEAMLNFLFRYEGVGVDYPGGTYTILSPRPGSSEWVDVLGPQHIYFPWGKKGTTTPAQVGDVYYDIYFQYQSPPALAGQGVVSTFWFSKGGNETYYYFPGQRRVRRLPTAAYDSPQIGFENQYTYDQPWLFNGSLDRFDWKIVGKKEMYIPYNSFGMFNFKQKLHDVALPKYLNNENRRYELHRVWVVEGTVKKGVRHTEPKKVFYIDEDSWLAVVGEGYDGKGALWKVRESYPIPVWELGGTFANLPFVQYDLTNGRYIYDQGCIGIGKDIHWLEETRDSRFRPGFFTADTLRALSER
jgi:hypothetical protein